MWRHPNVRHLTRIWFRLVLVPFVRYLPNVYGVVCCWYATRMNMIKSKHVFRTCGFVRWNWNPDKNRTVAFGISVDTLRPRQNGRHFADDIFKYIFLNENVWIPIKISLKFVPKGRTNNIPALVQIMAWRRPGDKPLSEPMMVSLPTHICVTRPQWVNALVQITWKYEIANL